MTIPSVIDLAADPITHHRDDMIAPSGLTNFLGTCRVNHDLTEVGGVTFPPVSQGLTRTATLFVDGKLFGSYGVPVTYSWRPDCLIREASVAQWDIKTTTVCVPGQQAVAIEVEVHNPQETERTVVFGLGLSAAVTLTETVWGDAESPSAMNTVVAGDGVLEFSNASGDAWSFQGVDVPADTLMRPLDESAAGDIAIGGVGALGDINLTLTVPAKGSARFGFVDAVGRTREECQKTFETVISDVQASVKESTTFWNEQLEAAFTLGNTEYSGAIPVLETSSPDLLRLYWWSVLGVIWFRRDFAGNFLGRSFDTLSPNYWSTTTFIWDYSLSSVSHALLDPEEMRRQLLHWMNLDIHTHFGTSSINGGPVGRWYSVNDYAMVRMVADYVRITGDVEFLNEDYGEGTVYEGILKWATAWKGLRKGSELADYGGIDNLLECVSTYTHEVAGLNAANVWCMNTAADLADLLGKKDQAVELRIEAQELLPHVLDLYIPGTGFFVARQPDGTRIPVRHCYDFSVVATTIDEYLPEQMKQEMRQYFSEELRADNWLHALSPLDPDASFSVRPDHQWNGAYPAWPADAGRALARLGGGAELLEWLPGLALTANQGPMGQAHFVEEAVPGINGGARKAPPQLPYITDWACSSSGAWLELIVESVFGVELGVDGTVHAGGPIADLDPNAVLRGLRVGGKLVDVDGMGRVTPHKG